MRRRPSRLAAAVAGAAVAALALAGCSAGDDVDPAGIEPAEGMVEDGAADGEALDDALADRDGLGAPEECLDAYAYAVGVADIADVEAVPADWPEPPAGSTLCVTAGGGSVETASYVTTAGIEEVLAHYEAVLPAGYDRYRVSGEENGTGYESLDGQGPDVAFQIRESDGGFVIAFALQEASE